MENVASALKWYFIYTVFFWLVKCMAYGHEECSIKIIPIEIIERRGTNVSGSHTSRLPGALTGGKEKFGTLVEGRGAPPKNFFAAKLSVRYALRHSI